MILWTFIVLFSAFFVLLLWALWMPLRLEVDTEQELFRMEWRRLVSGRWYPAGDGGQIEIRALFYRKKMSLARLAEGGSNAGTMSRKGGAKTDPKKPDKKPVSNGSLRSGLAAVRELLKAVHVRHCRISLDTGDFALNARLVPVYFFLRRQNLWAEINFQGKTEISLLIEARPSAVLWVMIKRFTRSKFTKTTKS